VFVFIPKKKLISFANDPIFGVFIIPIILKTIAFAIIVRTHCLGIRILDIPYCAFLLRLLDRDALFHECVEADVFPLLARHNHSIW
jgi:hypothetical protein